MCDENEENKKRLPKQKILMEGVYKAALEKQRQRIQRHLRYGFSVKKGTNSRVTSE